MPATRTRGFPGERYGRLVVLEDAPKRRGVRYNRVLAFDGRSQTLAAWAEEIGVSYKTLTTRLSRGWSVERVLTQPVAQKDQSWRS
jgi:hypothetical protein